MNASLSKRKKFQRNKWKVFKNDIALYVMLFFGCHSYYIRYIPMAGTIIAFKIMTLRGYLGE